MKHKFPGFKKCMELMRKHDPQTQEDGFHLLLPHAAQHIPELIEEFHKENSHGLRYWLVELVGSAKSPESFPFLAEQLCNPDERIRYWAMWGLRALDTKQARTLLWEARSFTFATPEETAFFRTELDRVMTEGV